MTRSPREEVPLRGWRLRARLASTSATTSSMQGGRTRRLKHMRNLGRPRPLIVAIVQATYRPIAQPMFDIELERVVARTRAWSRSWRGSTRARRRSSACGNGSRGWRSGGRMRDRWSSRIA